MRNLSMDFNSETQTLIVTLLAYCHTGMSKKIKVKYYYKKQTFFSLIFLMADIIPTITLKKILPAITSIAKSWLWPSVINS